MHLLILSNRFDKEVVQLWIGYQAATDGVDIKCHTLSRVMSSALFDYHVTIVDLSLDYPNRFTPVTLEELPLALEQGRTIIFITGTPPRSVQDTSIYGRLKSVNVYPQAAIGRNIQFTQHGKAQIFQDYFQNVNEYLAHWTATDEAISEKTIAVIGETELVIAGEYSIERGKLVVLPPPSHDEAVVGKVIQSLYNMARKYYEDTQKRIFVGDEPVWVEEHKTQEHLQIIDNIEDLELRKQGLDMIIYLLYGTGPELEDSVKLTLERLGLEVEKTPPGANIDFTARNADETIKLAVEVTGTTDKIKKESKKVPQAWMYLGEKQDEQEKLVLMANTYRHLPIEGRTDKLHFTSHVKNKFTEISALLMTTADLYFLWKDVHEKKRDADEVLKLLYKSKGILAIPSS